MHASERDTTQRWLARWQQVGPLLDEERWQRLVRASDHELTAQALDLLALWRPDVPGDDGAALVTVQRVFRRLPLHTTAAR